MNKYLISLGLLVLILFFDTHKVICDWSVSDKIQAPFTDLNLDKGSSTSASSTIPILMGVVTGAVLTVAFIWWIDYPIRPETTPQTWGQVPVSAGFSTPALFTVSEPQISEELKTALTELGAASAEPNGLVMTKAKPITHDLVRGWINTPNPTDISLDTRMSESEEKLDSV